MDKPVVIVALESLPYEVVVADIDVVLVNVGVTILRSDDDLIIAAPGDSVDTLLVETVCVCKAETKVRLPSVVVKHMSGISEVCYGLSLAKTPENGHIVGIDKIMMSSIEHLSVLTSFVLWYPWFNNLVVITFPHSIKS